MAANTFANLKDEYATLWQAMRIRPERLAEIRHIFSRLTNPANKARYQSVDAAVGVPWFVIAIIHNLEASRNFATHLHNGDPLSARTVHVPRNRPPTGSPPFTWEESARDALEFDDLTGIAPWTVERIAFQLEKYNGFGVRNHHPHVKSPYLWSFSNIYTRGKYIADGVWSENAVSAQCGGMVMLRYMVEQGVITVPTEGTATPPEVEPPRPSVPTFPGRYLQNPLENDPHVEIVQRRLKELGIDPGTIDADFGPDTEQAVRLFQARSTDETGEPLEIDGIVGPKTWAALFDPGTSPSPDVPPAETPTSLTEAVLDIAADEVGVREQPPGSNRGPRVDEFIRSVGLNPAQDSFPWCMCFVFWCFVQAAQRTGAPNLVPKTGGVHLAWQRSQGRSGVTVVSAAQARRDPALVKPGMAFFIDTGGGRGHTGIVSANVNSFLETIEGNTNDNGSREGIGVFRRTRRRITDINLGFAGYS
jgi:lysozyme family protein/peptidoglycan hydrolase-like protein with peptidoglycan-binding domain